MILDIASLLADIGIVVMLYLLVQQLRAQAAAVRPRRLSTEGGLERLERHVEMMDALTSEKHRDLIRRLVEAEVVAAGACQEAVERTEDELEASMVDAARRSRWWKGLDVLKNQVVPIALKKLNDYVKNACGVGGR